MQYIYIYIYYLRWSKLVSTTPKSMYIVSINRLLYYVKLFSVLNIYLWIKNVKLNKKCEF